MNRAYFSSRTIKSTALVLSVATATLLLVMGVQAQWSEPDCDPPGCNVDAPINVGGDTQTKQGGLNLGGDLNLQDNALIISSGDGKIYRSGGQLTIEADDNWHWRSSWDNHNEMTLHYKDGLSVRSLAQAEDFCTHAGVCLEDVSSSRITGSGSAGQVTFWTGSSSIGGNNNLYWNNSSARLGIGTTSPSYRLQVAGSTRIDSYLGVGVNPSSTYRIYASGASYGIRADGSTMGGYFRDSGGTSYTYVAYLDWGLYSVSDKNYFSGDVGIGTTNPSQKLDVRGDTYISGRLGTLGRSVDCPNGWGCGVHTWDVYADASMRTHMLCLGGGQGTSNTGDCRTSWPDGNGASIGGDVISHSMPAQTGWSPPAGLWVCGGDQILYQIYTGSRWQGASTGLIVSDGTTDRVRLWNYNDQDNRTVYCRSVTL